ncbi:uncharacterized protein M421DRAFT_420304 [Didymella exigua CBS 183.55]|uniref:Uncharacterized protein n=1 Tax=Didymella exigua CBS 183.55 TaxID=1150837 RepID=A0A6A5RPK4_9PLEO|nr:uncharacterized protein M421DRAFT_420304 [Didymella exigua CBS 183.55]KAF1929078.1 hypothetical protein M421DRAFT_420304 [Didymella exigua CBS 183.55]
MAVRTQEKPHKAEDEGDVSHCVHNLIEAFTNGLNIFKRLRERRTKHKARKEIQAPEPINSAELQLSNSLRRGPQDLSERYEDCYGQRGMGSRFAKGDSIAHASLAEILMRLNTGLVGIITAFLHHEQKGTHGHMKMNYKSLTDLSEASRRDALTSMSQLYQRLSHSQLQIHPALRTKTPLYVESSGNSSDSSKDTKKSTASKRRPSGSHVTKMATKSSSQPQLCMVRSKSRNTTRRDSTSKSSTSKPSSKSTSPHASPYISPLQSPVPEYAVLDPMIFNRPDMKSGPQAPLPLSHSDRKRIDSLDVVCPAAWSPYAQPYDYFSFMPEQSHQPTPKLPDFTSTPRRPSTSNPKNSTSSPKKQQPPPVPAKPSALSNSKLDAMSVASAIPSPLHPTPMKRRLDKMTLSSYTFASDSTKLGEIPETRWAKPWDYERAEMLNNMAAAAAKVRVPSPAQEEKGKSRDKEREKKGLKFWKRGEMV